ncbi:hypothetical protein FA15DRAFT_689394 [Coprinopsis marcescibilis]|uniref:F-box domain-containing protein n=1 Tax=Coprinopsis marcescibilis TaxID=230819 RepID=A0A5C3KIZ5_COPMA|nr:hypothetical protein FA15DRAFT_689394 [Coprinopsis marcescibilis]
MSSALPRRLPRKSILKSQRPLISPRTLALSLSITDRFPLELFRIIIDWLYTSNDRHALNACALVCRAWLPLCRVHYTPRMTVSPANASEFLDITSSPHLTIASTVTQLTLQKQETMVDHFFIVNSSSPPSPCTQFSLGHLLSSAQPLASITKLTLQKGYGETREIAPHLHAFAQLQDLELRSFEFTSFSDLTAVIASQAQLRRLSLTDIAWRDWGLPSALADRTHRLPPGLRHLEVFMEHSAGLFQWMLAEFRAQPLEFVQLGGIMEVEDAIAVSRFLRGLGSVLKHLRLYSPSRISQVNLVHNTGLESLIISHLHMHDSKDPGNSHHHNRTDEVCTILSQLCSPSLCSISLQLLLTDPESFSTIDWQDVARILSLPRYRNLKSFEFRIPGLKRSMVGMILKNIPDAAEKGILSVVKG